MMYLSFSTPATPTFRCTRCSILIVSFAIRRIREVRVWRVAIFVSAIGTKRVKATLSPTDWATALFRKIHL